jgi:DNA-binding transcriptional LysR family regulator
MNLDYLKTYLDVVRLGSFSDVAKKLSLSQPAVSFQIQKLERELGVRLIDRSQKSIAMTEAGKRVYAFAEAAERDYARLLHNLEQLRQDVVGELIVGASTIPGEYLLPVILSDFKTQHPAVSVQVEVLDSLQVISDVEAGKYEVGFCGTPPQGRELESFRIGKDEIVLVVFPEHPFASREQIPVEEVIDEPLIFREKTSGTQKSIEVKLHEMGYNIEHLSPHLVMGSTQAVVSAVEAKAGIAFISSLAIRKSVALGLVKVVKVEGLDLDRDFLCIYRKERVVSRLLEEFITFVQSGVPYA